MPRSTPSEWVAAAAFFGRLLVAELNSAICERWSEPSLRDALQDLGITAPEAKDLPELAALYYERFLGPADGLPPVQSLWTEGRYDGEAAVALRRLAQAAGRELAAGSRRAPPDHLGSILCLWSDVVEEHQDIADQLVAHHLPWGRAALASTAAHDDFYGAVARSVQELIDALVHPADMIDQHG